MKNEEGKISTEFEGALVVTEEDYQEGLRRGWTDDDMLKPGRYKLKRANFRERFPDLKEAIERARAKSLGSEESETEVEALDGRVS
jgi:hypothetical protein